MPATGGGMALAFSQSPPIRGMSAYGTAAVGAKRATGVSEVPAVPALAASIPDKVQRTSKAKCVARCGTQIQSRLCF